MIQVMRKHETTSVRSPAVAGTFYPANPDVLRYEIAGFLQEAKRLGPIPKALIVPHAGYQFSGAVAASAYALLKPIRNRIERVVLVGPSHRVAFRGLATTSPAAFATPLGQVPIDREGVTASLQRPNVRVLDEAHRQEHSLEVQLPFLQLTLNEFSLVPFAVGQADAGEVADVLDSLWVGDDTLVVISSDLSHYHDYWTAHTIDHETSDLIERCEWRRLSGERACGYVGIRGLLQIVQKRGLRVRTVDLRSSGDTFGMKSDVVGYGAYVVH
jgi:AmmeMemoRadiSam system protein B